jgi:predicted dehydrogenase
MEEARSVQAALEKSKGICQIGYEMRSSPLALKVKEVIKSGQLGRVVLLWANMFRGGSESEWRNDRATCGGVFFDCFIHEINELLCWADADFERLSAFGAPAGEKGACADVSPETVVGCMEFANAIRAGVCFSSVSQTTDNTHFGVVGDQGRIDGNPWLPEGAGSLKIYTHGGLFRTEVVIDGKKASTGHLGFAEQYDFFVRGARGGKALICDIDDAIRTQRTMKAFDRSLAEGRVVERNEFD